MKANIIGEDWEGCYLNEFESSAGRRKQVLEDLDKELENPHVVGEIISIDCTDHSTACEQFEVIAIFPKSKIVKLEYIGGAS